MRSLFLPLALLLYLAATAVSAQPAATSAQATTLLRPARVFDGVSAQSREGWVVLVRGDRIAAVGPSAKVQPPEGAEVIDLPGTTLLPGLIEGHEARPSYSEEELRLIVETARSSGRPVVVHASTAEGIRRRGDGWSGDHRAWRRGDA